MTNPGVLASMMTKIIITQITLMISHSKDNTYPKMRQIQIKDDKIQLDKGIEII